MLINFNKMNKILISKWPNIRHFLTGFTPLLFSNLNQGAKNHCGALNSLKCNCMVWMHDTDYLLIALPLKTIDLKNVWTEPEYINIPPPPFLQQKRYFRHGLYIWFCDVILHSEFSKKIDELIIYITFTHRCRAWINQKQWHWKNDR